MVRKLFLICCLAPWSFCVCGIERYVSSEGGHIPPFIDWAGAATNIQAAIDVSTNGDVVWVTNGVYATGGRATIGSLTNRVAIDKPITVQSLNGPEATTIQGEWDATTTNGPGAMRCVWMTNGTTLNGFTVRGGATRSTGAMTSIQDGGGIWCSSTNVTIMNCIIVSNSARMMGGGVLGGYLTNCQVLGNQASTGGGIAARGGVSPLPFLARNCLIASNLAGIGGGTTGGQLDNCRVEFNSAGTGGGANGGTLNFCNISTNRSNTGGGTFGGLLNNCRVVGNSSGSGGGMFRGAVFNSLIQGNISTNAGGGAYETRLINCTITANRLRGNGIEAGVAIGIMGAVTNCIIWDNRTGLGELANIGNFVTMHFTCTFPLPNGLGNIRADPQLLSDGIHISSTSPCRQRGSQSVVMGVDFDGQSWSNAPSMGCDEWNPESLLISSPSPKPALKSGMLLIGAEIAGEEPYCLWFKDNQLLEDGPHYTNTHTPRLAVKGFGPDDAGDYQMLFTNTSGTVTSEVFQATVHCVDVGAQTPLPPYSEWTTAAATIQDAVDFADPGAVVVVTNGVHTNGGKAIGSDLPNRVALHKAVFVHGINGPDVSIIEGDWDPITTNGPFAIRCVWLTNGAVLNGFTLKNGATLAEGDTNGGGAWGTPYSTIANCILSNNAAASEGGGGYGAFFQRCKIINNRSVNGGGISDAEARNCVLAGNLAANRGGGSYFSTLTGCFLKENRALSSAGASYFGDLIHCTVISNTIPFGGGGQIAGTVSSARNCIIYYNYADTSLTPANVSAGSYFNSCTTPIFGNNGNISDEPQLLDDFHIATTSPCRSAADPLYMLGTDLDGEPWKNPPSMGCDEVFEEAINGPLGVNVRTYWGNTVPTLGNIPFLATVDGRATRLTWSYGDGVTLTNPSRLLVSHIWTNAGDYNVLFTAYNADHPEGVSTNMLIHVVPLDEPPISMSHVGGNILNFSFPGQPGIRYTLESVTNLVPPTVWQLESVFFSTGAVYQTSRPIEAIPGKFYRVKAETL